jgi:hypothetical protein
MLVASNGPFAEAKDVITRVSWYFPTSSRDEALWHKIFRRERAAFFPAHGPVDARIREFTCSQKEYASLTKGSG